MKQAKKMLCMLLVMLLAFSTVSIGVNAARAEYKSAPGKGYDVHETPVLSTEQRASQLLDYLDGILAEEDIYIDAVVLKIDITSVDAALNTIDKIKDLTGVLGGDVADLNFDALDAGVRRTTAGKSDLHVLYMLLDFLNDNRGIVGKFLRGNLDLGLILNELVDLSELNVYTMLIDMLYEAMVDENAEAAPAGWSADKILQHAIDVIVLGGTAADGDVEEGYLPSLAGKTDIQTFTIWQIIENAANAATKDIIVPFIENDLGAYIDDLKAQYPLDAWRLVNIDNLSMSNYTWGQYDKTNGIAAEINHFIWYVLDQVWVGEPFWQDGGNDKLQSNIEALLKILYAELGTAILPASAEFLPVEEVNAMDLQQIVTYIAKQFIAAEMDYVLFEDRYGDPLPLDNIGQLACYVIYSFAAEIIPTDYMTGVDWGDYEYGQDFALLMLSDIAAYYLNAALPMEPAIYGQGYESLLRKVVNWALQDNNFGGFFKGCGVSDADTVWTKIDKTVLKVLPLQQIFGGNVTGSKDLIMNRLVDGIFNLDLERIFELLYKSSSSVLNKTGSDFVVWLVNNVLNVIIAGNTNPAMIPTSCKTVDSIIQNSNLAVVGENLLNALYKTAGSSSYFWDSLLPILCPLMVDESGYAYNVITPPAGYSINTLAGLQAQVDLYEEKLSLPEDLFSTEPDDWHRSEDYELWRYDKVEAAMDYAWDVINGYNSAVEDLAAAQAAGDAEAVADAQARLASYNAATYANAAYEIEYYADKAMAAQNEAAIYHLSVILELADNKGYRKSNYSKEVWAQYEKAYDHASLLVYELPVVDEANGYKPVMKQSTVNYARRALMDAIELLEVKLADMEPLKEYIAQVENTNTSSYSAETVAAFEAALAHAKDIASQLLTIDDQDVVDDALADLQKAFENLAEDANVVIELIDKDVDVDEDNSFIAGLETLLAPQKLLSNYIKASEGGKINVVTVNGNAAIGTGAKVQLLTDSNALVKEYEVVIYGDANGDGMVDLMDTICLDLYTVYEMNYANGSAQWTALNLNGDSSLDTSDVLILDGYANFENEINQQNPFAG